MFANNNNLARYDDDDDSFVPHTSSTTNLANLFNGFAPSSTLQGDAATLTYLAPKQPPKHAADSTKQTQKKLACLKTISLSRYFKETGFSSIGRFGIAIIAGDADSDAHLLLYKTQACILSATHLSSKLHCTLVDDVTLQFTDDNAERWRVVFDSECERADMLAELKKHTLPALSLADEAEAAATPPPDVVASSPMPKEERARADILERISKVGQRIAPSHPAVLPALPLPSASPPQPQQQHHSVAKCASELDDDEHTSHKSALRMRHRHSDVFCDAHTGMNVVSKSSSYVCTASNPLMDPINIYFAENRTHNSEVRMHLATLASKIDSLLLQRAPPPTAHEALEKRIAELEQRQHMQLPENADRTHGELLQQRVASLQQELKAKGEAFEEAARQWTHTETMLQAKNGELTEKVARLQRAVDEQQVRLEAHKQREGKTQCEHALEVERLRSLCAREETLLTNVAKNAMSALYERIMRAYAQQPQCLTVIKDLKKMHQEQMRVTTFQIIHDFVRERNKLDSGAVSATMPNSMEVSPEFEVTV